jgi:hypothetical protein
VKLYRCFAWNASAKPGQPDGPLWIPRSLQGDGRHDNPDRFGCLYLSEHAVSPVVEQLAPFRGHTLTPGMLRRRGLPLAIAELILPDSTTLIDLDDPVVLRREKMRPSLVATRERSKTQPQARELHERHPDAAGLRWWSSFESLWINVTIFDRGASHLKVQSVRRLTINEPLVGEAAEFLGLTGVG